MGSRSGQNCPASTAQRARLRFSVRARRVGTARVAVDLRRSSNVGTAHRRILRVHCTHVACAPRTRLVVVADGCARVEAQLDCAPHGPFSACISTAACRRTRGTCSARTGRTACRPRQRPSSGTAHPGSLTDCAHARTAVLVLTQVCRSAASRHSANHSAR